MQRVTIIASSFKKNLPQIEGFEPVERGVCARAENIKAPQGEFDIFVETNPKPKKLLVCDMESTIIQNEFLDEIADFMGIGEKVAEITARAMNGELDFKSALLERIQLIKGLKKEDAENILKTRLKYNEGAQELIAAMKARGVHTMLVSGGFTLFTDFVAKDLGFDEHHANELVFGHGKLAGINEAILGKEAKLMLLLQKCKSLSISAENAVAIGDGANDLPMLKAAGLGIAYKAKPIVKKEIANQINYSDLSAIRFLV